MSSPIRSVLILKADQLYASALVGAAARAFPAAELIVVRSVRDAEAALARRPALLVAGVEAREGDVLEFLERRRALFPVLLLAEAEEERVLAAAEELGIEGVFDPEGAEPAALVAALQQVANGAVYRSETLRRPTLKQRGLTAGEQLFFAILGDGSDDHAAADVLHVSRHTVATVRRELHRKLRIQHRGELIRSAVQQGYVRFTAHGIVRPGLGLLVAAYHAARARRAPREAKVVHLAPLLRSSARCA